MLRHDQITVNVNVLIACTWDAPSSVGLSCCRIITLYRRAYTCMLVHVLRTALQSRQRHRAARFALQAKNAALKEAGAVVPESFEGLEGTVGRVYQQLVADGVITPRPEPTPPSVPQDLSAAKKAGKV